jgi:hypothetical protein
VDVGPVSEAGQISRGFFRAVAVPQGLTFPLIAENVKLMPLPGSEVVDFPPGPSLRRGT